MSADGCNVQELNLSNSNLVGIIPSEIGNLSNLTRLNLSANSLSGSIPSTIGDLSNLVQIWLFNNQLSGVLPSEISNLSNLTHLGLGRNQLTETIPASYGNLNNLGFLSLKNNQLSGCFDDNLNNICTAGNDSRINTGNNFDVSWSTFCATGNGGCAPPPPTCRYLDSLVLIKIYESANGANWTNTWNLNQPISTWHGITLNSYNCVQELDLSNNNLVGTIPSEIGDLAALTRLLMQNNQLSANIPATVGNLSNLLQIWLFSNQLSGQLPSEIGNLSQLTHLGIGGNQLTGTIPASYGNMSNLGFLALKNNNLFGCFDNNLTNICAAGNDSRINSGNNFDASWSNFCTNGSGACQSYSPATDSLALVDFYHATSGAGWITTWDLNQPINKWVGISLNSDGRVIGLELPKNELRGYIPTTIDNLNLLISLDLSGDFVFCSDPFYCYGETNYLSNIPPELGNLDNLISLNLSFTELNGSIPPELGNLNNLKYLSLHSNYFTGNIPPELGNLANLEQLDLSANYSLSGSIPIELTNLDSLNILNLSYNKISGSIPIELTNLHNLSVLDLRGNNLTGSILHELGNLGKLNELHLSSNLLTGSIPTELGNLTELGLLSLSYNQLSGNIPSELGDLNNLYGLYISDNQLSGCFDDNLLNICLAGSDTQINTNNNFDASWSDFCENGSGSCSTPPTTCSYLDSLILMDFYNATNGPNWTTTWNTAQPISIWYGVTLNTDGCVERLTLPNNNLVGTLPTSIGGLSAIQHIWLYSNQLSGTLPPEIGNLSNLTHLSISNNQLTGSIPASYGNLSNLGFLALKNNQLSGCYDVNLLNICAAGTDSRVSGGNNFSASWSAFCTNGAGVCQANSPAIDSLALLAFYHATNGPNWSIKWNLNQPMSTWDGITLNSGGRVTDIRISDNNQNGHIPPEIGNLTELVSLTMIPTYYCYETNIGPYCYPIASQISGQIPPELGNLTNLEYLGLSSNGLSGNIPLELGNLNSLNYLGLSSNQLSGCYDANLLNICAGGTDWTVSIGNNFSASWSDFCTNLTGCCNCRLDMSDNLVEADENLINLYPNPAHQFINIDIQTKNDDELNYLIYNTLGKAVQSGQIQAQKGTHQYQIELNLLNTGVYYFNLMTGDKQITKNFTVIQP